MNDVLKSLTIYGGEGRARSPGPLRLPARTLEKRLSGFSVRRWAREISLAGFLDQMKGRAGWKAETGQRTNVAGTIVSGAVG